MSEANRGGWHLPRCLPRDSQKPIMAGYELPAGFFVSHDILLLFFLFHIHHNKIFLALVYGHLSIPYILVCY